MSEPSPLQDVFGDTADEELVFDELEPVGTPPLPEPKIAKSRRAPRRAEASQPEVATPAPEAPAEPVANVPVPAPSAAALEATAGEPAGAVALFPPQAGPAGSSASPWMMATAALALLSTTLSLGGVIAVGRTLSRVDAAQQQAAHERDQLARVPALLAHMEQASARMDALSAKLAAGAPSGPPISADDLKHELDALKLDLAQHQPQGVDALGGTTREGFAAVTMRLDALSARLGQPVGRAPSAPAGQLHP